MNVVAMQIHELEVACAELKSLPSGRSVYRKSGGIFMRSDVKTALDFQRNELEKAKAKVKSRGQSKTK
ncbi:hypothetical protein O6H91_09G121500 [Diphasiastrum complanatum]|uniref:Uncharacterized protein n=1 Tax=Diphasiastrum complanatum TaxID=34168 RepID=A0ACC2CTU3_DIPCM|nr:hypothetical protein O6H91_09G121500 [Diphasiastrum complanatum]